jgi:hypothetical protein
MQPEILELLKQYLPQSEEQFAGKEDIGELLQEPEEDIEEKTARINSLDELIKLSEEDFLIKLARFDINLAYNLSDNLETLNEWEYKYSRIFYSKKTNPYRKEKLLDTIEQQLRPVVENIKEALLDVYTEWLAKHALLDPKEWAKARVDYDDFEAYGEETSLSNTKYEYERLGGENFEIEFFKTNLEYFTNFFKEVRYDIINHYYEELEYAETHENEEDIERYKEDIETLENYDFDNEEDFNSFVGEYYYIDEYVDEAMVSNLFQHHSELYEMILEFLEKKVFPLWFAKWEPEGIVETRENIEELYLKLQNTDKLPFQQIPGVISEALSSSHQTGPMMDYISEHHDIDFDFLLSLDKPEEEIEKWNRELSYLGVW